MAALLLAGQGGRNGTATDIFVIKHMKKNKPTAADG
jgi:hypothetical protein